MKNQLLNLKMIALMCLMMVLGGANVLAADKITDVANIVSGGKYYICAGDGKGYLQLASKNLSSSVKGTCVGDKTDANVFIFEGSGNQWTIKIDGTSNYLSLNSIRDNGAVQIVSTAKSFTLSNVSGGLIKLAFGDYSIQKNNQGTNTNFGSYKNTQKDVWLEQAAPAKALTSLAISGQPTKTTYEVGEEFDPTGLVVTGTYDDNTTATITDGITWAMNPATLSLNDVSCSVTATVDGVTSPAYNVTGLTVNKAKLPATITLTGNATTLGIDESNKFTVDYDGDGTLSATASAEGVVDLALVGKTVTVTPKAVGSVDITVAATEGTEYKAASKTYTVTVVPVGIAAIRNSITSISSSKKDAFTAKIKNAVVTYVGKPTYSGGAKTIYVEDANAGIVFYDSDFTYEEGDVLNGTISGVGYISQGLTQVTSIDNVSDITVVKGGKIPCTEITLAELTNDMDKWESRRVKVVNTTLTSVNEKRKAVISQDGKSITVFEKYDGCSGDKLATANVTFASIVGYPLAFKQRTTSPIVNELCIWEESDIVVATAVPTYTAQTLTLKATDGSYNYSTFSSDKVTFFPEASLIPCAITVANGKINQNMEAFAKQTETINNDEVPGYYIPANTGVMFMSDVVDVTYYTVENKTVDALAEGTNMLMPAPVAGGEFTAEPGKVYYKLAYNNYEDKAGLGFYWGAEAGGAFSVKAGTAYLAVPAGDATAKGFTLSGEATGIEGVNANVENAKAIYNLNGQRVASMAKPGLYIVNGKKVVRK